MAISPPSILLHHFRLILFDQIAKEELQSSMLAYRLIHAFESTLAVFDKMCDCAHYTPSAKMPQLLDFLGE